MSSYHELIRAGYRPEQIISCPANPCPCKTYGPQKQCQFPSWINPAPDASVGINPAGVFHTVVGR